jgi:hypothetical protein
MELKKKEVQSATILVAGTQANYTITASVTYSGAQVQQIYNGTVNADNTSVADFNQYAKDGLNINFRDENEAEVLTAVKDYCAQVREAIAADTLE